MTTKDHLLKLLSAVVPTADYLSAENVAVLLERDYGTLTDLRESRKYALRMLEHFAEAIDKLKMDVEHIKRKPVMYRELMDSLKQTERFPMDDEQLEQAA